MSLSQKRVVRSARTSNEPSPLALSPRSTVLHRPSIALMNALEDLPHLRTTVSTNLTNSKAGSYNSEDILLLLETEQALRAADTLKRSRNNHAIESTALAAQTKTSKSNNTPTCSGCKRTGHNNEYCIMPGSEEG